MVLAFLRLASILWLETKPSREKAKKRFSELALETNLFPLSFGWGVQCFSSLHHCFSGWKQRTGVWWRQKLAVSMWMEEPKIDSLSGEGGVRKGAFVGGNGRLKKWKQRSDFARGPWGGNWKG